MRGLRITIAIITLTMLTGCLSHIPDSGTVSYGAEAYAPSEQNFVRTLVSPPNPGATPQDLIREFLAAAAGDQGDYATSRLYLAPEIRYSWQPQVEVRIYSGRLQNIHLRAPRELNTYGLTGPRLGTIDQQGHYQREFSGASLSEYFSLQQVDGQWRISSLADGRLLSESDVARSYRRLNIYFLNSSKRSLVPDPVYLPVTLGISTSLINALLAGPTTWLSPAVTSAIPFSTSLVAGSVPIQQGVASVDLSAPAVRISSSDVRALSAQIVWTLKQLAEVAAVRITFGRVPLIVAGSGQAQSRFSYSNFSPDVLAGVSPSFVIGDQGISQITGLTSKPTFAVVESSKAGAVSRFRAAAVSLDSKSLAGITEANSLVSGPMAGPFALRAVGIAGTEWLPPSWDADGNLWAVQKSANRSDIYVITPDGRTIAVEAGLFANLNVQGFRIARDGSRAAYAIANGDSSRLFVARVIHFGLGMDPKLRVEAPIEIPWSGGPIGSISWIDAMDLAILTASEPRSIWRVGIDGPEQINLAGIVEPIVMTSAPGMPMLAIDREGRLSALVGESWFVIGTGKYPIYPG